MDRPPHRCEDAELVLQVREGGQRAFEELVRRHGDVLGFNANAFYAPGGTGEDLLQIARIGLYKAAVTFDPSRGASFRSFAQLAIRAELITAVKKAQRLKHRALNTSARWETPLTGDGDDTLADVIAAPSREQPEERMIAREEFARFIAICEGQLSETERVVLGRRLRGLSLAECGAGLGSAARADKVADNALGRIRRKLAA